LGGSTVVLWLDVGVGDDINLGLSGAGTQQAMQPLQSSAAEDRAAAVMSKVTRCM
jgi:phosphotransferase system HPr-like phosphotransfer protein